MWEAIQKDMLPGVDEEGGETEPKDVAGEEYQAELAASMSCDPALIKQLVKIGLYVGARAEIAEYDKAFDTQVGDRSGYGVDLSPAGDIYAGMYAGGVRAGVGALKTKEGTVYAGEWLGGKRHGKGSMTYKDGGKYVGKWSYGKRHGAGTFTYSNGDSYTGQWHAGNKHGEGKYSAVEAKVVYEGTWKHGALVASKVVMLSAENAAYYGGFDKAGRPTGAGAFATATASPSLAITTHRRLRRPRAMSRPCPAGGLEGRRVRQGRGDDGRRPQDHLLHGQADAQRCDRRRARLWQGHPVREDHREVRPCSHLDRRPAPRGGGRSG